jgi:hypothetical protein
VLGVVDHALARPAQERDRVGDHPQVLLAVDLHDDVEVQRPGLAHERAHRRDRLGERDQRGIRVRGQFAPAGHPERGDLRMAEMRAREHLEELALLGVRLREAGFDQLDSQLVQAVGDAQLLLGREGHALALHPVSQGCVI